jgi:hypothetical protein
VRRLVRTCNRNIEIFRLLGSQLGELDIQAGQMGAGDFLVKFLREDVHAEREVLVTGPESNLSQDLVGEGAGHDKGGMAGCTTIYNCECRIEVEYGTRTQD